MCVISIIENLNQIPSKQTTELMEKSNPHGNGFCYYNKKQKCIYMKKGITLDELNELTNKAKKEGNLSMIQHYRIASSGNSESKLNTHGFLIENMSNNDLECHTNKDVFFHNGTLDMDKLNEIAVKIMLLNKYAVYPTNKDNTEISDSRLCSWILSFVDYSILNLFTDNNKFVIMNGRSGKITKYGSWDLVKDDTNNNTLVTSNNYFKQTYFLNSCFDHHNYEQYYTKEEKKEIKRVLKKFKNVGLTKDQIYDEYLEYGTSVYDIEDQIESELKMSEGNYEY
jgi:predicted glutamine amidotransferase